MKDFNLRQRLCFAVILLLLLPGGMAQAEEETQGTSAEALGVSEYRHFMIYPRLEKALRALQNNDEATAIREFEHLHRQLPENIPLTLYLAETYRKFGHDRRARTLLLDGLKRAPGDTRLRRRLEVIPVSVRNKQELLELQQQCEMFPSTQCRSTTGYHALRLASLDIARQQLNDPAFADTAEGKKLRNNLLHRAIYLRQWALADALFSESPQLSDKERRQWFEVLLAGHLDDKLQALQSKGLFNSPEDILAYAVSLEKRGNRARLQRFLAGTQPEFETAAQEKGWLHLLSRYSDSPQDALAGYTIRFTENRPPAPSLDQQTWQLIQNGRSHEAAQVLLQHYPFQGDTPTTRLLMARLVELLKAHPQWATEKQMARLLEPLSSPSLRQLQSQLPGVAQNCEVVRHLLGDMSAEYDAVAWRMLAQCYRDQLPGMALYAYQQAEEREPEHRSVAYQAWQVQDYATALRAWKSLHTNELSDDDLLAAVNTAQAAGDTVFRERWLQEAHKRGLDNTAHYWWLHAQHFLPGQPQKALEDLARSISIQPSVEAYRTRAGIYQRAGNLSSEISDLQQALALSPQDSATQAMLGYALWDAGDIARARVLLEASHNTQPNDPALIRQLAWANQRLGDAEQAQFYARQVIDEANKQQQVEPLSAEQHQQLFDFRRLHEDVARRWSFNIDTSIGMRSDATGTTTIDAGGASPGKTYRSYAQFEAEYRLGRSVLLDEDLLSVYSRVFADTGTSTVVLPVKHPMLGTGLLWKPLRDEIWFLALEQQIPLEKQYGEADAMLRASTSLLNAGHYSDEWHPNGAGWMANSLYLDGAYYLRRNIQAWTVDYRISWHQKVAYGQTVEPYLHLQHNGYRYRSTQSALVGGSGLRWNIWSGETDYNAWPHRISLGLEYQRTFSTVSRDVGTRNNLFLTIGVNW